MRPPICFRYAMWTVAASLSEKYTCYEDILYERARKYAEAAEMKGSGETFVSIYHAQTWSLIGTFEANRSYFSRAWVSVGRLVRLVQSEHSNPLLYSMVILSIVPPKSNLSHLPLVILEKKKLLWVLLKNNEV